MRQAFFYLAGGLLFEPRVLRSFVWVPRHDRPRLPVGSRRCRVMAPTKQLAAHGPGARCPCRHLDHSFQTGSVPRSTKSQYLKRR